MVALAGFSGLFVGVLITFFSCKSYYDEQDKMVKCLIKSLKMQRDYYADAYRALKKAKTGKVEIINRHEFATPEQVNDLKFGG